MLEQVLLYLPMATILISQRVSQQWQSTIQASLKLQKLLFLAGEIPATRTSNRQKNELLHQRFPGWKGARRINDYGDEVVSFAHLGYTKDFDPYHVVDPAGSWRRMFITQPPTEDLEFFQATGNDLVDGDSDDDDFIERETFQVHAAGGITMGFLAQEVEKAFKTKPGDAWGIDSVLEDVDWVLRIW